MEIQHLYFTCSNQLEFTKYHVVKKSITWRLPSSYLRSHSIYKYWALLIVTFVSTDSSFTMKLCKTAAKLVKVVLNHLFTVPHRDVPE